MDVTDEGYGPYNLRENRSRDFAKLIGKINKG